MDLRALSQQGEAVLSKAASIEPAPASNVETPAVMDTKTAATVLWKYTDPDTGKDFYLPEKVTTVKNPWTGKSMTVKPVKFNLSDVGKELKEDEKKNKGKGKKASDDRAVDELVMYIQQAPVMASLHKTVVASLQRRQLTDPQPDVWRLVATAGAASYVKELGVAGDSVEQRFPQDVRQQAAQVLAEVEADNVAQGVYQPLVEQQVGIKEAHDMALALLEQRMSHQGMVTVRTAFDGVETALQAGARAAELAPQGATAYVRAVLGALQNLQTTCQHVATQLELRTQ